MLRNHLLTTAIVCTAATFAFTANAQQSITIRSPADSFAVNSTAMATAKRQGPFLEVSITEHSVWASKKYTGKHHIVSYTAAIATHNKQGQWETQRHSKPVQSGFTIAPGETRQMTPTKLLIPIDGIENLHNYWIVLTVKLRAPEARGEYGYTYAHSEKLKLAP